MNHAADRFSHIVSRLNSWLNKHISDITKYGHFNRINADFPKVTNTYSNARTIASDEDEKWTIWFSYENRAISRIILRINTSEKDVMEPTLG